MTFPTGTVITTANLDSADDDPSLARVDLLSLVVAFNQLIASQNIALGVAVLDGSGKITSTLLPSTYATTSGSISLNPANGVININKVLRLSNLSVANLGSALGTTAPSPGDMAFLTDGDAGSPCLAVYDGTAWKVVRLMTAVGDVGAAFTTAFTLTATAVP